MRSFGLSNENLTFKFLPAHPGIMRSEKQPIRARTLSFSDSNFLLSKLFGHTYGSFLNSL